MPLTMNVGIGQYVEIEDRHSGLIGGLRVDSKSGRTVRMIFDMPRSVVVRVLDRRDIRFGLSMPYERISA